MVAHSTEPWPSRPKRQMTARPLPRLRPGDNVFRYFDSTERIAAHAEATAWQIVSLEAAIAGDDDEARHWGGVLEHNLYLLRQTLAEANAELRRRRELAARPGAPPWPNDRADSRAELDAIKAALPLDRAVAALFPDCRLERRGRELVGRCPLGTHEDRDPSFAVNPERGLWRCWGCGERGDLFDLAMLALGVPFAGAVAALKPEAAFATTGRWGGEAADG